MIRFSTMSVLVLRAVLFAVIATVRAYYLFRDNQVVLKTLVSRHAHPYRTVIDAEANRHFSR